MRSRIVGTGRYVVNGTNETPRAPLQPGSVSQRQIVAGETSAKGQETVSDLALAAAIPALRAASCSARDIDCLIFTTQTPEYFLPGSGCVLAAKLGLIGVPAIDVRNQCSGFLYGLSVADHFIRLGTYRRVLVVAAEVANYAIDLRPSVVLEADAAGAVILAPERDERCGILATGLHTDGRFAQVMMAALPGQRGHLAPAETTAPQSNAFEIKREGSNRMLSSLTEALHACSLGAADVKLIILDPIPLKRVLRVWCRHELPTDRILEDPALPKNLGSASIPVSLDSAVRASRVSRGDIVVLCAFGPGFSWAWSVLHW